ncbi:hypothetical protein [Streptomyces aureus]|uniref:hypothetical protein n=1 Tax=Streptomyces aureus TaxID=193461 RepID=UPI0007C4E225|nr:hypothetical protein [Streptomyces aureus]
MRKQGRARAIGGMTAATAVALVVVQGSAAGSGGGGREPVAEHTSVCVGTRAAHTPPGREPAVIRMASYADGIGKGRHKDVYTGVSVDERHKAVDVYRIPSKAFDADLCAHAEKGLKVRIHDTDVTERRLMTLVDRVGDDMDRWDGRFRLNQVGPDIHGYVIFGVDRPATAEPILKKAFGAFWARHIKVIRTQTPSTDSGTARLG